MRKRTMLLSVLAVILVMRIAADTAWAYFTTYAQAKGGYTISLGDETTVDEDFSAWTKHVSIANSIDSEPVFIRVKAFCGSEYSLVYSDANGKWTPKEDGYYYYSDPVDGGAATEELLVKIENVPEDVKDAALFHVVVVYETTPALYGEDGTPYADWTQTVDSGTLEGGM